jgi:hypothetical protein
MLPSARSKVSTEFTGSFAVTNIVGEISISPNTAFVLSFPHFTMKHALPAPGQLLSTVHLLRTDAQVSVSAQKL